MRFLRILAVAGALGAALAPRPGAAEEIITLPTRPGVTQSFFLSKPAEAPAASVILFAGGDGRLYGSGGKPNTNNFLVRSRELFLAQGFTVAVIDVPSDESGGMQQFRWSESHRRDIAFVIAYLRQLAPVPVWLVGTSRGTISAANGAALKEGGPDGLVLTSSVTRNNKRGEGSVFDTDPGRVTVPTLIVHNRDDGCQVCPFGDVPDLLDHFKNAPRRELIAFEGGATTLSAPCEALSRHGYIGIEDKVVGAIGSWIKAN